MSVSAKNQSGKTITSFGGKVTLSSTDGQAVNLLSPLVFDEGKATATVSLDTADTLALTATSGSTTGTSGTITNSPAAAASFVVSTPATGDSRHRLRRHDHGQGRIREYRRRLERRRDAHQQRRPANRSSVVAGVYKWHSHGERRFKHHRHGGDHGSCAAINGTSGPIVVGARSVMNDWFSQNMSDPDLQDLARADFTRDGSLTYNDMLDIFAEAESEGPLTGAALQSLRALATPAGAALWTCHVRCKA